MLTSTPFSFMVRIYWLSVVAFFLFMFLKLEMCAVNLDLKVLLVKPVYVSCLSQEATDLKRSHIYLQTARCFDL